jgi:choline dehydrogenase-like flavoprotein
MQNLYDLEQDPLPPALLSISVCVIGSGPAGGIVAGELALAGIDVLLLESGNKAPDYDPNPMVRELDVTGGPTMRFGFSKQFGGSTNLWSGRVAPFDAIDFEKRSWVPNSGWPFSREEITPYYNRAASILDIGEHSYFEQLNYSSQNGTEFAKKLAKDLQTGDMEAKQFLWTDNPFNVREYLIEIMKKTSSLKVVLNAPVQRLHENKEGTHIDHAVVKTSSGKTIDIKAKIFVLAAGGIETPRILLNSKNRRESGVGNDYDNVGRYFSTHPKADMAALILKEPIPTNSPLFVDYSLGNQRIRNGVGFSALAQERLGLLNHYVQLSPLFEYYANSLFEKIKGSSVINSKFIDKNQLVRGLLPGLGLLAFEAISRMAGWQARARKFILRGFLDQYPVPENRVRLSDEKDKNGMFKTDVIWRFSEQDRESALSFFSHLDEIVQKCGLGYVDYKRLYAMKEWPLVGIHSHFMGTTRMGDDPRTAVTTKDAQVYGTRNLFIAGPSLFPSYGFANPVYTILALSLKLTEHLINRLKS